MTTTFRVIHKPHASRLRAEWYRDHAAGWPGCECGPMSDRRPWRWTLRLPQEQFLRAAWMVANWGVRLEVIPDAPPDSIGAAMFGIDTAGKRV